jgi:hypothetical protein
LPAPAVAKAVSANVTAAPSAGVFASATAAAIAAASTVTKLWKPGKFQCTGVIFKNLVVYIGLDTDDLKTLLANFLYQKHKRKYIS